MLEVTLFPLAALLYTVAIFGAHHKGAMTRRYMQVFLTALGIDTLATIVVCSLRTGSLVPTTIHGWIGYAALIIMAIHALWAHHAVVRPGAAMIRFHQWSRYAWAFWMVTFVSGAML